MSWQRTIGSKVRELRVVCCQKSEASAGARNFVKGNYLSVMAEHPEFLFIVRETENAIPTVMARYDFGVERRVPIEGYTQDEVEELVEALVDQADEVNSSIV